MAVRGQTNVTKAPFRQEVNLYLPELRPQFDPLSPKLAAAACGVVAVLMLLMAAASYWQIQVIETQNLALQTQQQQLEKTVTDLRRAAPKSHAARINLELEKLREDVASRQLIREIISGQNLGNAQGFSGHFHGFSRQVGRELALQRFYLSRGGAHVELQGVARKAAAVPRFVELLQGEAPFKRATFGQLQIVQPQGADTAREELEFRLGRELASLGEEG
jgi:Tfp pilus assembly protein PilN